MSNARGIVLALLVLATVGSAIWVWQLRREQEPPTLIGPPRADYLLYDFDLIALDEDGKESFAASGPRLTRHPSLGTLDIEAPRFSSPDSNGRVWTGKAKRAWVNKEGTELRMLGDASVSSPTVANQAPTLLRSESLVVFPREHRVASDVAVTVTEPGSILSAIGMRANLDAQQVELLSDVRIHHDARKPRSSQSQSSKPRSGQSPSGQYQSRR